MKFHLAVSVASVVAVVGLGASGSAAPATSFSGGSPMIVASNGATYVVPHVVALDAAGARYVSGNFYGSVDFDPGAGVRTLASDSLANTAFVSRFDADGTWRWTQTFGGTGDTNVDGAALVVVGSTVYMAGDFHSDDARIGDGPTISSHPGADSGGAGYVVALDAATGAATPAFGTRGALVFGAGSPAADAYATSLASDGATLFVGGAFRSIDLGVGGGGAVVGGGGFVAALDLATGAGKPEFSGDAVQTFAGDGGDEVNCLAVDSGVLYVGGATHSGDFGIGGAGAVSASFGDAFVAALDASTGEKIDAFGGDGIVTFSAGGEAYGRAIAVAAGRVYLAGDTFFDVLDGPSVAPRIDDALVPDTPSNAGFHQMFVLALQASDGAPVAEFAHGVQFYGAGLDVWGDSPVPFGIVASQSGVYVLGSAGDARRDGIADVPTGSGGPAHAFIVALEPSTGLGLHGFAFEGVLTAGSEHGNAYVGIAGIALDEGSLVVVGDTDFGRRGDFGRFFGPDPARSAKFASSGAFLVDIDPATGAQRNMRLPAFLAPPVATPNPCVAGRRVTFSAAAEDPTGRRLSFEWSDDDVGVPADFFSPAGPRRAGDSRVTKTFAAAGTYLITARADNRLTGAADSETLRLVVLPAGTPVFEATKAVVSLNFTAMGRDSIAVEGLVPLADGTSLDGRRFAVDVGGVSRAFTLDASGRARQGRESVAVRAPKDGVARFAVRLSGGSFSESFVDEGMTAERIVRRFTPTIVTVSVDGVPHSETMPLFYSNGSGRAGAAR
jgi:hypothetical protein